MRSRSRSLFGQSLDRSVFVAFFLGGVVPLCGLAVVSQRLLPAIGDTSRQAALVAFVVATALLSLGAFLALRRLVQDAVDRMAAQNARLAALLDVARELSEAPHAREVTESTSRWALRLADAEASWLLTRRAGPNPPEPAKPPEVLGQRGDRAGEWLEAHLDEWLDAWTARSGDAGPGGTADLVGEGVGSPHFVLTPLTSEHEPEGLLVVARSDRAFDPGEVDVLRALAAQAGVALTNAERGDVQRNFFSHMTDLVTVALDTHIDHRAGHASRVAEIANRVGRRMGLDEAALHDLHFAALLHDVGMLKIPLEHQRDPRYFRKHPAFGARMLSRIRVWQSAAPIVHQHHERIDGQGYPDGIAGDAICLGARILSVCDAWDAMRRRDAHREALAVPEALAELHAHADSQFDATVVRALEDLSREGAL